MLALLYNTRPRLHVIRNDVEEVVLDVGGSTESVFKLNVLILVKYLSFCRICYVEFLVNNIVILANYFIHKCRFFNNPPTLLLSQQDLMIFFKSLKIMRSEKALKLCGLLRIEPLELY